MNINQILSDMTTDAGQAAMGFVVSQATHIEAGVYSAVYGDIQYQDLVPVDRSAHPFAKSVTYYSMDMYGKAKWINGNADDIPKAGTEINKSETAVYTAGIGYGFGWEEVGLAMKLGINLEANDAAAARRAAEEFIDDVALRGSPAKNLTGLINSTAVTAANATTGTWTTATNVNLIMADFNQGLMGVATDTIYTPGAMADTVLIPWERMNFLANYFIPNTSKTLLQHLQETNIYTTVTGRKLTIRAVRGLETAGVGSTKRMVAYRRSPEVLKLHMPMPFRFFPVWQSGPLRWDVPGALRLGGVDIRLPKEIRYVDGI